MNMLNVIVFGILTVSSVAAMDRTPVHDGDRFFFQSPLPSPVTVAIPVNNADFITPPRAPRQTVAVIGTPNHMPFPDFNVSPVHHHGSPVGSVLDDATDLGFSDDEDDEIGLPVGVSVFGDDTHVNDALPNGIVPPQSASVGSIDGKKGFSIFVTPYLPTSFGEKSPQSVCCDMDRLASSSLQTPYMPFTENKGPAGIFGEFDPAVTQDHYGIFLNDNADDAELSVISASNNNGSSSILNRAFIDSPVPEESVNVGDIYLDSIAHDDAGGQNLVDVAHNLFGDDSEDDDTDTDD